MGERSGGSYAGRPASFIGILIFCRRAAKSGCQSVIAHTHLLRLSQSRWLGADC